MLRGIFALSLLVSGLGAVELRVATFNIETHRNEEGWPDYALDAPGTVDFDSVAAILGRIDADVVALQEVHTSDISEGDLAALGTALGLPHQYAGINSGNFDTSLRVAFLSRHPFVTMESILSPVGAKEIARHSPAVVVDVPGTDNDPLLISAHLKSGSETENRFRRAVEMKRLVEYLATSGYGESDNFIVLGDFNPSGNDTSFIAEPSNLPGSYSRGGDVTFPVSYTTNMTAYFSGPVPTLLDPRQLDGDDATYIFGQTLDLVMVSPALGGRRYATEIYNSDIDSANGQGLLKAGNPLPQETSTEASDHFAVFGDFQLDPALPFVLTGPGDSVTDDFRGISGTLDPAPWSSDSVAWLGRGDGSSGGEGARAYGTGAEWAVGHSSASSPMTLGSTITNGSLQPITLLDFSYNAEVWKWRADGAADAIRVELETPEGLMSLGVLDFAPGVGTTAGDVATKSLRVGGLTIAPGEEFDLNFRFEPGPGATLPSDDVWINEFHYDNAGGDSGEFVEVVMGTGYAGGEESVEILFYNGSGGGVYKSETLEDFTEATSPPKGYRIFSKSISGIQNGAPDGIALVVGGVVEEFLSYEGMITASGGAASGMTSTDVGVQQDGNVPIGAGAIRRVGGGSVPPDFTWERNDAVAHSAGSVNSGQSLVVSGPPPQGLAVDDVMVTFVADTDGDGIGNDEDPDDDNDGLSDEDELAFGTDPEDAGSRFEVLVVGGVSGPELSFPGAEGILYTIEWCDDLVSWDQSTTIEGQDAQIIFPLPTGEDRVFARVRAGE